MNTGHNSLDSVQTLETVAPKKKRLGRNPNAADLATPDTFRARLNQYSSHALVAVRHFVHVLVETVGNMATALAGSIIMLPVFIVARAIQVALDTVFSSFKALLLSLLRAFFEGLRVLIAPLHEGFVWYNQQVLKPLLKQIQDDDATALVAFGVLVLVVIGMVMVLPRVF